MSWKAVEWAKTWREELTSPEAFVLFLLAEHYNPVERRAWPKISTLVSLTRLSRSTVIRALNGLEAKGLIEREEWETERGAQLSTRYCLPMFDSNSVRVPLRPGQRRRVRQQFGPAGEWETEDAPDLEGVAF